MKIIVSLLLLLTASQGVFAGCEKPAAGYDSTYCLAKLFVESDNELNDTYKNLSSLLNSDQKKKLIAVQRSWIKFRNSKCSDGGTITVDCNYDVNKNRAKFLLDRITECKIGSCKIDLIASENFD